MSQRILNFGSNCASVHITLSFSLILGSGTSLLSVCNLGRLSITGSLKWYLGRQEGDGFLKIWEETFQMEGWREEDHGRYAGVNQHTEGLLGCSKVPPDIMRSPRGFLLRRVIWFGYFRQYNSLQNTRWSIENMMVDGSYFLKTRHHLDSPGKGVSVRSCLD